MTEEQWAEVRSQTLRALAPTNSLEGLIAYGEYVFGYQPAPHHIVMLEAILHAIYTKQDTLILMPAGSAKTTWGNTITLCWLISMFKDIRVGLMSETSTFAEAFSSAIMNTFEGNDKHRELFGDIAMGGKWTQGSWHRKGSKWASSKDFTVFAGGSGGQVASKRFDLLLCDDILGKENTATVDQREKIRAWFDNPLSARVVAQGVTIVFGTRWAEDDLYELLGRPVEEGGYGFNVVLMKALIEDPGPDGEYFTDEGERRVRLDGYRSYWEDVWPVEDLLKRRKRNPAHFDCVYNNDVAGLISGDIFQRKWIKYYGTPTGDPDAELPPDGQLKRMGQDFAFSVKTRADYTARVTTAEGLDGNFYVMRTFRDKIAVGHPEFIKEGYEEFPGISIVICEDNQAQSTIVQQVARDYPQIPVVGRPSDTDKRTRASAVAEKYKMGRVYHHASLKDQDLEREMMAFKGNGSSHDDLVDALGFSMDLGGGSFFFGKIDVRR